MRGEAACRPAPCFVDRLAFVVVLRRRPLRKRDGLFFWTEQQLSVHSGGMWRQSGVAEQDIDLPPLQTLRSPLLSLRSSISLAPKPRSMLWTSMHTNGLGSARACALDRRERGVAAVVADGSRRMVPELQRQRRRCGQVSQRPRATDRAAAKPMARERLAGGRARSASKGGDNFGRGLNQEAYGANAVENCLKRLQTDSIEVYLSHRDDMATARGRAGGVCPNSSNRAK